MFNKDTESTNEDEIDITGKVDSAVSIQKELIDSEAKNADKATPSKVKSKQKKYEAPAYTVEWKYCTCLNLKWKPDL